MSTNHPSVDHPAEQANFLLWLKIGTVVINIVLLAISMTHLTASRTRILESVKTSTASTATLLESNMTDFARRIDLTLQAVADFAEHRAHEGPLKDEDIDALLALHRQRHPEINGLRMTDAQGNVRWGTGVNRSRMANWSSREYFPPHRDHPGKQLIVTEPIVGSITNQWIIAFTRSWLKPDGSFGGIVSAALPIQHFTDMLKLANLGPNGSAVIRLRNKALITRYPPAEGPAGQVGEKVVSGGFAEFIDSGQHKGFFHANPAPDGIERISASVQLRDLGFYLNVGMSPQDFMHDWYAELRNTIIMLVAFMLASLLTVQTLARNWRQRHAELEALQKAGAAHALLVEAVNNVAVGFVIFDEQDRLLLCNDSYLDLYDTSRDLIVPGRTFEEIVRLGAQRGQYREAIGRGEDWIRERVAKHQSADGTPYEQHLCDGRWLMIIEHRTPEGYIVGNRIDITPLKRAEVELRTQQQHLESLVTERTAALSLAKEVAESANRAKSTFLANMSHELRTPMTAIMGMTLLAQNRVTDPKVKDQLSKIDQASHHLLHVINDILDISKIEAEKLTLEHTELRLRHIFNNLSDLMSQRAEHAGIALRLDLPDELADLPLSGDPLRLSQILINITGNAFKFTSHGVISVRAIKLEESPAALILKFEVQDTGIGIEETDQARLFSAFEQADGSMTRKYGGTGLGLAISKRLAEMMGGQIGVRSTPGQGSTFWFTVRFARIAATAPQSGAMPAHDPHAARDLLAKHYAGTRILVAEDDPFSQEVIRDVLESAGLAVDTADDGDIAIEKASRQHYALILLDMQMPKLNGTEAARAIRRLPGYATTPILAATANAYESDRQACLNAGMNDHISKPFAPSLLYEAILRWLGNAHC